MRKAAKRDANEREIIDALEAYGVSVTRLSQEGVPDLLCSTKKGKWWFLVEVKSAKGCLTTEQANFIAEHGAWVHIA